MSSWDEIAKKILQHPQGGVKPLLDFAGNSEREWLELKAATMPEDGVFGDKYNEADYAWNIAKAVIALANTVGGVVLLGIDDNLIPIGLDNSDPRGILSNEGVESYIRKYLFPKILLPAKGWKTKRGDHIKLKNSIEQLRYLITIEDFLFDSRRVLAILVGPVLNGYGKIEVEITNSSSDNVDNHIYVRRLNGKIGQVFTISGQDNNQLVLHEEQCDRYLKSVNDTYTQFLYNASLSKAKNELKEDIQNYLDNLSSALSIDADKYVSLMIRNESDSTVRKSKDNWLNIGNSSTKFEASDIIKRGETLALICGEAGSGKSTLIEKIVFNAANDYLSSTNNRWPLLLSLGEYGEGGLQDLCETHSGMLWSDIAPLINSGEVMLFLDGLDECPSHLYEKCCKDIQVFISVYRNIQLYATSRVGMETTSLAGKLKTFRLLPLDSTQQKQFIQNYLPSTFSHDEISSQISSHPGLKDIASSPILLRIISEIAKYEEKIPVERVQLYEHFINNWFRREQQNGYGRFSYEQTINA